MALVAYAALYRGDYAVCQREAEGLAEGVAYRGDLIADGQVTAFPEARGFKPARLYFEHRDIAQLIRADKLRLILGIVGKLHRGAVAAADDVRVR